MYNIDFENASSPLTIDHFNRILYWPHMVAYLLYLVQKCLMLLALIGHFLCEKKTGEFKFFQCFDLAGLTILGATCCYGCVCCCSCGCNDDVKKNVTKPFVSFLYKSRAKFDRWVVKIILGKDERIVSRVDDYVNDKEIDGIPTLYIHNNELTHIQIRALYLLVFMFGLLTLGSAWSTFIFNITHICVDDHPNIYCFALSNGYNTQLNISKERVINCSKWSDMNEIEFTCFQYAYNTADALATFGGLLALFQVAVTAGTSAVLSFIEFILSCAQPNRDDEETNIPNKEVDINVENGEADAQDKDNSTQNEENSKFNNHKGRVLRSCKRWIKRFRHFFSIIAAIAEISIAIGVTVLLKTLDEPSVGVISSFLLNHSSQILIVIAIIGTIPLLPLEDYAVTLQVSRSVTPAGQQGEQEDTQLLAYTR